MPDLEFRLTRGDRVRAFFPAYYAYPCWKYLRVLGGGLNDDRTLTVTEDGVTALVGVDAGRSVPLTDGYLAIEVMSGRREFLDLPLGPWSGATPDGSRRRCGQADRRVSVSPRSPHFRRDPPPGLSPRALGSLICLERAAASARSPLRKPGGGGAPGR